MSRSPFTFLGFILFNFVLMSSSVFATTVIYHSSQINKLSPYASPPFYIQKGAYSTHSQALSVAHDIHHHYPIFIKKHHGLYAVMIGPIQSLKALKNINQRVKSKRREMSHPPEEGWARFSTPTYRHWDYAPRPKHPHYKKPTPAPAQTMASRSPAPFSRQTVYKPTLYSPQIHTPSYGQVVTLNLGPAWTTNGSTQTIRHNTDLQRTYQAYSNSSNLTSGELFFGWQSVYPLALNQIGLAVVVAGPAQFNGAALNTGEVSFQDYTYRYQVIHGHLAIKEKVLSAENFYLQPYLSGSIGLGINHAKNFSFTPALYEDITIPVFSNNSTLSFTYTAGMGIQKTFADRWSIGVGYEFADWGNSHLGVAPDQTQGTGVSSSHIYTHELQFSLTAVI